MNKFLDLAKPPKLNQGEVNNLNWPIKNEELKRIIRKAFQLKRKKKKKKSQVPDRFTAEFYQTFKDYL